MTTLNRGAGRDLGKFVKQAPDAQAGYMRDCRKTLTGTPTVDYVNIPDGARGCRLKPATITARWAVDEDPDTAIQALTAAARTPFSVGASAAADEWTLPRLFADGAKKLHIIGSGAGTIDIEFF